jgi:hypothetical protein
MGNKKLPPWFIFKGKVQMKAWHSVLKSGTISLSKNGWTDNELGLEWLKGCFEKETNIVHSKEGYRILCLDRHSSHITNKAICFCIEKKIILLCLPPHTTHMLQPLDLKIFAPLAMAYRQGIAKQCCLGSSYSIDKITFLQIMQEAREKAITDENIKSAWANAGLKPFDPTIVLNKLPPTQHYEEQPSTPCSKLVDDKLPLTTPANILQVEVLLHQAIANSNSNNLEIISKLSKAACRAIADAHIQRSTNIELVKAAKAKPRKRSSTRENYGQARVMDMEVVKEREAKIAEKAIQNAWQHLSKITPSIFQESSSKSPTKPKCSGNGNARAFTTAAKPFLQLSPGIFSQHRFLPTKPIPAFKSPSKIYAKSPIKQIARLLSPRKVLRKGTVQDAVVQDVARPVAPPSFTRSGRLRRERVIWEPK